jgi:Transglutaminase-like superfamily
MKLPRILKMIMGFRELDGQARVQLCEAFLLPFAIWAGFRVVGVAQTQRALRSWSAGSKPLWEEAEGAMRVIACACRAQRTVRRVTGSGGTCLVRSFTLWAMLRSRGVETDIRVGMRRSDGKIAGHAWLEYGGHPLNETRAVVDTHEALPGPVAFDLWPSA